MAHYIHDEKNNRIECMSKEEIYALLAAAIQSGELPSVDEDTAFVTMFKSIVDGKTYKMAFCTQAQYNELKDNNELVADAYYIITDDTSYNDLIQYIATVLRALNDEVAAREAADNKKVEITTEQGGIFTIINTNGKFKVSVEENGGDYNSYFTQDLNGFILRHESDTTIQELVITDTTIYLKKDNTIYDLYSYLDKHLYRHDIKFYIGSEYLVMCTLYLTVNSALTNVTLANYINSGIKVLATGYYKSTPNADPKVVISLSRDNSNWKLTTIDNVDFNITSITTISSTFYDDITQIY